MSVHRTKVGKRESLALECVVLLAGCIESLLYAVCFRLLGMKYIGFM